MVLENHIAYRFLMDDTLAWEMTEATFPKLKAATMQELQSAADDVGSENFVFFARCRELHNNLSPSNNTSYYITETLIEKLSLLKVGKTKEYNVKLEDVEEYDGTLMTYDWQAFSGIKRLFTKEKTKITFILPDQGYIRMITTDKGWMSFVVAKMTNIHNNNGTLQWTMFWVNVFNDSVSKHWRHQDVQNVEEMVFKILCFMYLSENEEVIVEPKQRYGTRKSGKLVNSLPFPVTVVNSKWNITLIRTEGFQVSGHFRLQPTRSGPKMIWIDPFMKHGYVRKSKA